MSLRSIMQSSLAEGSSSTTKTLLLDSIRSSLIIADIIYGAFASALEKLLEVVASFGFGCTSKHWSFRRGRESRPSAAHFQWLADKIPIHFIGMTARHGF